MRRAASVDLSSKPPIDWQGVAMPALGSGEMVGDAWRNNSIGELSLESGRPVEPHGLSVPKPN